MTDKPIIPTIIADLKTQFADDLLSETTDERNEIALRFKPENIFKILAYLKDTHRFDMLLDLTAIDYSGYLNISDKSHRFGVVYFLHSMSHKGRLTIEACLPETDPTIDSVVFLWRGANWLEREAYDMFGITFSGHPDLRRILYPEEYSEFPLRKEYSVTQRRE